MQKNAALSSWARRPFRQPDFAEIIFASYPCIRAIRGHSHWTDMREIAPGLASEVPFWTSWSVAKPRSQNEQPKNAPAPASPQLSLKRKRVFRLVVVLSPFVILLVLELALRAIGYGYPTDFFIESATPGFLVTNDKFAAQFFSKRNTSRPVYCRLAVQKPAGTIRIFVLGE